MPAHGVPLSIGKGRVLTEGADVAILCFGAHLTECRLAAEALEAEGISVTLADARFAKPLDADLIAQLARHHPVMVTVEQGARGGFGAQVLEHMANDGLLDGRTRLRTMTLPDRFIDQASPAAMYREAGLTATDIARVATVALGRKDQPAQIRPIRA
jgi:1-deoxy-D-xylulose-5-phosphate synthase